MRETFRGWYKPTDSELDVLWDKGLVVLDANALLAPYRVRVDTQKLLFDVLEACHDQLWCPYQAALEYQRNRLTVVSQQMSEYDAIRKKIDAARKDLLQRRHDHPVLDADRFEGLVQRSLAGIERFIRDTQASHPEVLGDDPDVDAIRDRWDELLAGRVGTRLEVDDAWRKQADIRYEEEIPPGFEDRKKDKHARRYGDLILWFELLEHVGRSKEREGSPVPVIFVTDDTKRDWWRSTEGHAVGPAPSLTEELATAGGAPFWMYSVARFVEEAARRRHWEVAPEVPQELRSAVPESAVDVASLGGDSGTLADDDGETDDVSELDSEVSADEK